MESIEEPFFIQTDNGVAVGMTRQRSHNISQSSRIYTPDNAATPTIMKILPSLDGIKVLSISATILFDVVSRLFVAFLGFFSGLYTKCVNIVLLKNLCLYDYLSVNRHYAEINSLQRRSNQLYR